MLDEWYFKKSKYDLWPSLGDITNTLAQFTNALMLRTLAIHPVRGNTIKMLLRSKYIPTTGWHCV